MKIIKNLNYIELRTSFLNSFIDKNATFEQEHLYEERILKTVDGLLNTGCLWDILKNPNIDKPKNLINMLSTKNIFYVLWDNSIYNIQMKDFDIFSILEVTFDEYLHIRNSIPEDHYCFDATFNWVVFFTHEYLDDGDEDNQYCGFILK